MRCCHHESEPRIRRCSIIPKHSYMSGLLSIPREGEALNLLCFIVIETTHAWCVLFLPVSLYP